MHGNHLLDLDVLMARLEKEMRAVGTDLLVLAKGQQEPLEATAGCALTDELVRSLPTECPGDADDILIECPEQDLVLG
jgi:hypothetical protein